MFVRRGKSNRLSKKRFLQGLIVLLLWALWSVFPSEIYKQSQSTEDLELVNATEKISSEVVRVCTWNVRNYSVAGRRINGKYVQVPKPETEKKHLRNVLKKINPDVLMIQEMGDIEFLRELQADLARENLKYPFIALTRYDAPSRLAILSKIKPVQIFDCCDIKFKFRGDNRFSPRGTLGMAFDSNGVRWYSFATHLKSPQGARKSDENFAPFRFAEMKAIDARIVKEIGKDNPIIMGGDFNQEPNSQLLKNLKRLKLQLLKQSDKWGKSHSYFWSKKNVYFMYDFFLVSDKMQNYISNKATIFDAGFIASDHRPIYVDLDFRKKSKN